MTTDPRKRRTLERAEDAMKDDEILCDVRFESRAQQLTADVLRKTEAWLESQRAKHGLPAEEFARRFAFQTKDRWEQRDGVMQLVVELRLIPMTVTT